jgi:hypothetical protein
MKVDFPGANVGPGRGGYLAGAGRELRWWQGTSTCRRPSPGPSPRARHEATTDYRSYRKRSSPGKE